MFKISQDKLDEFKTKTSTHSGFLAKNARPTIKVLVEVDKFRGFLKDVVSFEPDFILSTPRHRIHFFEEDCKKLFIHDLASQTTTHIPLRCQSFSLPAEFSSVQAQGKIFLCGGEKKEGDARWSYAKECFVVNENTNEVDRKADMKYPRCAHALVHVQKKNENRTKDYIYALGSKYPDESGKKAEFYDIAADVWSEIAEMNTPRHYAATTVIDNRYIYIIGGRDS
jgi:hypothetical protein